MDLKDKSKWMERLEKEPEREWCGCDGMKKRFGVPRGANPEFGCAKHGEAVVEAVGTFVVECSFPRHPFKAVAALCKACSTHVESNWIAYEL